MQTIKITISGLQSSHIVVKENKTEEIAKLIKLLKIIQPKEALQQ